MGVAMWCAECGQLMPPLDYGGYAKCCNGLGYWTKQAPLSRDIWWPVVQNKGLYLYRNEDKWPAGLLPVVPEGGES